MLRFTHRHCTQSTVKWRKVLSRFLCTFTMTGLDTTPLICPWLMQKEFSLAVSRTQLAPRRPSKPKPTKTPASMSRVVRLFRQAPWPRCLVNACAYFASRNRSGPTREAPRQRKSTLVQEYSKSWKSRSPPSCIAVIVFYRLPYFTSH